MELNHPVPQQISSYQFRLVGDMTLKQFFQLAGGGLVALLIYATPLPAIFKWPLIILFVILGAALAFLPIEERPLEVWIVAFFRSIYSPTVFYWRKPTGPVQYFLPELPGGEVAAAAVPAAAISPASNSPVARLEEAEKSFMSKLTGIFSLSHSAPATPQPVQATPPAEPQPLVVPKAPTVAVEKPVYKSPVPTQPIAPAPVQTTAVSETLVNQTPRAAQAAQFSPEAAPPMPPSLPNVIVGQVMDPSGKIVEGAILEVNDTAGRPVRALRTNKAGHFLIVTPLVNGTYTIVIEKQDLIFDPVTFEATGTIIQPLALKAKSAAPTN